MCIYCGSISPNLPTVGGRVLYNLTGIQFRSMWTEFEWENRVNVSTTVS